MRYFPMSVELTGKTVCLIGSGKQICDKKEKLLPFGATLQQKDDFTEEDAREMPAMVIVGDQPIEKAQRISELCCRYRIPVNVVDVPRLCSFYFPSLITKGDLTVSVSTGGSCGAASVQLRKRMEEALPDNTEQILQWLSENRGALKARGILQKAVAAALTANRPLTDAELSEL